MSAMQRLLSFVSPHSTLEICHSTFDFVNLPLAGPWFECGCECDQVAESQWRQA